MLGYRFTAFHNPIKAAENNSIRSALIYENNVDTNAYFLFLSNRLVYIS